MKTTLTAVLLFLFSSPAFAQPKPLVCANDYPCVYIVPQSTAPAVQIDATTSLGFGLLSQTSNGVAVWAGASGTGTAVWAAAAQGAVALRVQGAMVKPRVKGNLMRFYDPKTGALVAELEFEVVVQP